MIDTKIELKDLDKGLDYLKKHCNPVVITVKSDHLGRLMLSANNGSSDTITVILYGADSHLFPEVMKVERL